MHLALLPRTRLRLRARGQQNCDPATSTLKAFGKDALSNNDCYQCHTIVKAKDYIFQGISRDVIESYRWRHMCIA